MTNNWVNIGFALTFATIFALVSFVLGFGVFLSIVSGLIGAISGSNFIDRSTRNLDPCSQEIVEQLLRGELSGSSLASEQQELLRSRGGFSKLLLTLSIMFSRQSPYQRVASYTFLIQAVVGAISISLFCIAQAAGIVIDLVENPMLARHLANVFPMGDASAAARARFDHLFVPLISLHVISLMVFVIALLASVSAALRNIRKYAVVMLLAVVLPFGMWLFLSSASSTPSSLQRLIIGGHVWGYVVAFVFSPILYFVLTAALPTSGSNLKSTSGVRNGNG